MGIPMSLNCDGFADRYIPNMEYDMWDQYFGFEFGPYRIQIGDLNVRDGYVDWLLPVKHNSTFIFINLLEKDSDGRYIYWNRYEDLLESLRGLKSLMSFQSYIGITGKSYSQYEKTLDFDEIPF